MTTPSSVIIFHASAAVFAVLLGPWVISMRMGRQRPQLHRILGYIWTVMMLLTATSAIFIPSKLNPPFNWLGYSPIHLLIALTYFALFQSFRYLSKGNIQRHRKTMISLYVSACLVTGAFTLLPGRLMHSLLFS